MRACRGRRGAALVAHGRSFIRVVMATEFVYAAWCEVVCIVVARPAFGVDLSWRRVRARRRIPSARKRTRAETSSIRAAKRATTACASSSFWRAAISPLRALSRHECVFLRARTTAHWGSSVVFGRRAGMWKTNAGPRVDTSSKRAPKPSLCMCLFRTEPNDDGWMITRGACDITRRWHSQRVETKKSCE